MVSNIDPFPTTPDVYDVAVIGAGVVGAAVARRFALEGASVILIERGADILAGASKANSAILHTGFDAPPNSIELECMKEGYAAFMEIREALGLPLLKTGAMVVAWSEADLGRLDGIEAHARANHVCDVRRLDAGEVSRLEPNLAAARGALLVPGEYVIDPWSTPLAYVHQAIALGAQVVRSCEVMAGEFDGVWTLTTTRGSLRARHAINCAGLYGDILDERLTGTPGFQIRPRKGQFVVFDKIAAELVGRIILPVPSENTKGVVITRTIFGNLLVGPTAEEQPDRDMAATDPEALEQLRSAALRMVPALADVGITATYAGLRPATERKDYRIRHDPERNLIVAGGIRSTGLTAALGIAQYLYRLYASAGAQHCAPSAPAVPRVPMLAEHGRRDWQHPGFGDIVCHCEMVTRREIEAALQGPFPARDIGGLKRRTRAGMGRCQGFYCQPTIARLTEGLFAVTLAGDPSDA